LLSAAGVVRSDADMVFFGQPDHATGAVSLAADETGATTALHVRPSDIPGDVTEILLTAQLSPAPTGDRPTLDVYDLTNGRALGQLPLPQPEGRGLLQLGALQRAGNGWHLQLQSAALGHDLATLAKAAGVDVQ
jgi:stress response protein SCP2